MRYAIFILFFTSAFSQQRFLIHVDRSGKQEAVRLQNGDDASRMVSRWNSLLRSSGSTFLDSIQYFNQRSELSYEFGNLEEEMMMQWYQPGGNGFVREVWWAVAGDAGETKEVRIRAWYPNPRLKNVPSTQHQKNTGYYVNNNDPVNLVTPYRELATDTTWVFPPRTRDSLEYAFDPLGVEALWKKGGVVVPVSPYSWHALDLLATGDTMKFSEDQLIGFTVQNTATGSAAVRQEIVSMPNPDPPFHSYKFYPRGRLSSSDKGWWLRGDFEWGMFMVVEYFAAPKPKLSVRKLLNTASLSPRTVRATVRMQSTADPVEVKLFSKIGKGFWTSSTMVRENGFVFAGTISGGAAGDSVYYYFTAKDTLNRTTQSPTFDYQIFKKKKPLLLLFNAKSLPSGIVDPTIYLKFTMKTDIGAEPYYDFCNLSRYTVEDLHLLLEQYQAVVEVTGDGGFLNPMQYIASWLNNSASLPAGQKRYYLLSDQDRTFINQFRDTLFADNDPHSTYFGVKGLVQQDFPVIQNGNKEVTFPWQLTVPPSIAADEIFGFIPSALSADTATLWYHPYYEVPLFTNKMDEIQPAVNGQTLFTDKLSGKIVGVKAVDPSKKWQTYFLTFDWMALDLRGDTSTTLYEYPFLDPKYRWIVDVQNIGKSFAALTGVLNADEPRQRPSNFSLEQNYPNPFNPATTISYRLPGRRFVTLTVHDLLGKQVDRLVHQTQDAGTFSVQWNAARFPSGMYFYRMTAGEYTSVKKLLLLK